MGVGSATRGRDESSGSLFGRADLLAPVSRGHPLRAIRDLVQRDDHEEGHGPGGGCVGSRNILAGNGWFVPPAFPAYGFSLVQGQSGTGFLPRAGHFM